MTLSTVQRTPLNQRRRRSRVCGGVNPDLPITATQGAPGECRAATVQVGGNDSGLNVDGTVTPGTVETEPDATPAEEPTETPVIINYSAGPGAASTQTGPDVPGRK